jgi:hypothetical protein
VKQPVSIVKPALTVQSPVFPIGTDLVVSSRHSQIGNLGFEGLELNIDDLVRFVLCSPSIANTHGNSEALRRRSARKFFWHAIAAERISANSGLARTLAKKGSESIAGYEQ